MLTVASADDALDGQDLTGDRRGHAAEQPAGCPLPLNRGGAQDGAELREVQHMRDDDVPAGAEQRFLQRLRTPDELMGCGEDRDHGQGSEQHDDEKDLAASGALAAPAGPHLVGIVRVAFRAGDARASLATTFDAHRHTAGASLIGLAHEDGSRRRNRHPPGQQHGLRAEASTRDTPGREIIGACFANAPGEVSADAALAVGRARGTREACGATRDHIFACQAGQRGLRSHR
mmetsp:Transcript_57596/g.166726  ORF Transcript_57596/g.166726 Transcript_57596/m.166726 type:complete len:232 (+) Transcript_57596:1232-1927(+)